VSTVRYTNEEIRKRKGRVNHAKIRAATEEQIIAWKREDGFDDATLGPVRVVPAVPDVRALRERLGLSQEEFAARYMLGLRTVQEWEQHRREPSEAARVLLYAITQDPSAIARILHPDAA
jgi:DNA-binding transcriptional regulator YiaG